METYKQFISSVWCDGSAKLIGEYLTHSNNCVIIFYQIKESPGKSLLANNFTVKNKEHSYIYSGSSPLVVRKQQLLLF